MDNKVKYRCVEIKSHKSKSLKGENNVKLPLFINFLKHALNTQTYNILNTHLDTKIQNQSKSNPSLRNPYIQKLLKNV